MPISEQRAIGQLIEEQLVEPIEVARAHARERAGQAPVGEHNPHVGRHALQHPNRFGEVARLQRVVAIERQDKSGARFEKTPVARALQKSDGTPQI
jgi:hypothetical protein